MDEFRFEQDLVRALLRDQHPDLADPPTARNYSLRSITGGKRELSWHMCHDCRAGTWITSTARIDSGETSSTGHDPEVRPSRLTRLIAEPARLQYLKTGRRRFLHR